MAVINTKDNPLIIQSTAKGHFLPQFRAINAQLERPVKVKCVETQLENGNARLTTLITPTEKAKTRKKAKK